MAELIADKIGLTLPIFSAGRSSFDGKGKNADPRFVFTGRGKLVGFRALSDISFDLRDGDRLGIVGKNGSGKSTLLRTLGGVFETTEGRLQVAGQVRGIFNLSLGLNPESTGYRNIELMGLVAGLKRDEIRERLPEIVEFSELEDFLEMPVHTYSAGMRMRLLFSTVTSLRPDILLLDEWLGAGDMSFRKKASARMQEMVNEAGIVVLASHNHKLIRDNCNMCLWVDGGSPTMIGEPEEVIGAFEEFQKGNTRLPDVSGSKAASKDSQGALPND